MPQLLSSTHLTSGFNIIKVQIWPRKFPLCIGLLNAQKRYNMNKGVYFVPKLSNFKWCALGRMYIQNKCTFAPNVHSRRILSIIATLWLCLPNFDYDCYTVGMFATFWAWLLHCGHVCHVWLWLQYCGHVCHIFCLVARLWQCLSHFEYDCHNLWMFAMF